MKTFRFRDFAIYKCGIQFRKDVQTLLQKLPKKEQYRLVDQIDRAALSILLNIAEGSAKRSDRDFYRYLEISIASLNEVIAGLDCALEDQFISKEEMYDIEKSGTSLARQIGQFLKTLKANC